MAAAGRGRLGSTDIRTESQGIRTLTRVRMCACYLFLGVHFFCIHLITSLFLYKDLPYVRSSVAVNLTRLLHHKFLLKTTSPSHLVLKSHHLATTMPSVSKGSKVLVSGANGYIAMWVVRTLLERGFTVRGTVRTEDKGKFMIEYFKSLGYGDDKFEVVIVDDIVKVGSN